ncbi:MAG TPA: endonuclease domain-containing protein [Allosphingosinicella sp.]|jgi:very-short-patch-repair endonuclease
MKAVRTSPHLAPAALARARALRRDMTPAEPRLWSALRATFRDAHFRHQVPLGPYYPDFASHRARLVIEVDGGQHSQARDAERTRFLEGEGYRVLRFWNNEVMENLDGVLQVIAAALPSPLVGEGGAKRRMGGARRSRAPAPRAGTPTPRPPRKGEGAKGQPPVGVN